MNIDALLCRLDGVKETARGKYVARCPAHDDQSPSLAIKEGDDGRVLIHCFAGCATEDVLSAIGMTFSDIMPERIGAEHSYKPIRNRVNPRDALEALDHEALVVALVASDIHEHREIDDETWGRLSVAVGRINTARNACSPARHKA